MYPKPKYAVVTAISTLLVALLLFPACKQAKKVMNPALAQYIEAYTAGIISKQSTIRVQLTGNVNVTHTQNEPLEGGIFKFSPRIEGKAYWIDATTIEFRPDENLQPGKTYNATFHLSKVTKVPDDLSSFDFEFRIIKPAFSLEDNGLKATDNSTLDKMTFSGVIHTADVEDPQQVEKLVTNSYNGKTLPVTWQHNPAEKTSRFTIANIPRGNTTGKLELSWDGKPLGVDVTGKKSIEVPATGIFKVLNIRAVSEPEQHLLVQFSDPVSVAQNLDGLIGISGQSDLRYSIEGSEVKVFAPNRLEGNYTIAVNEGVINITDNRLGTTITGNVNFENTLPAVSIPGNGVILPQSNKLALPFEAVNLNAVDVTIIKIYEQNIPQYLQTNNLNGDQELRRVGKPVVEKTIRLDMDKSLNLHKRNRFFLDLDKLLRTEPGAIYRVTIGFRKAYALQTCSSKEGNEEDSDAAQDEEDYYYGDAIDEDDAFWQRYNSYYPYGYNWEERNSPCSNSYYAKDKWASRNIITSNIGLTAKRGNDNSMVIAVTDIRDTKPLIGVELELLDYQQQVIYKTKSDGDGMASFDLKRKPWLLIAKKDDERGYLKLDDGSSLPLSRFDVKGEVVQNGIKGFLYGERGVWRPGDSLFLTFILEDKDNKLPENHPVTLELYNPKGQLYKRLIQHQSLNGFYSFITATAPEDPTGSWSAKVKVGGAVFQKNLRIETVKPNRLKIQLDFGKAALSQKTATAGTLAAQWLFGATAQHLKAKVDVSLRSQATHFPKFDGYTFDDPVTHFETEDKTLFEGPLDDNGTAQVSANLPLGKLAPGQLKANFEVKVFEPGGDFSIDHFSMPYNPFATYAGLRIPEGDRLTGMLVTDKPHPVSIVNVDEQGRLLPGNRDVQVELYKIRWRWWWDENDSEAFSNFTQDSYNQLLQKETLTLHNGKGEWNLEIKYPDWGRYLVRVKDLQSGHTAGQTVYIDWPGWAQRMQKENPAEAAMLVFTSDKTRYNVGDDITLTIPSSEGGRGLVSIESGSRVLKTAWIKTEKGQTTYRFTAEKNMAPNIYVNVSLLQPHAQTVNDLPIRMYGTIPIAISDPNTILQPQVKLPATLRPEQEAAITVSEAKGKAMTYTIAIVDEGLLDLTRFKTPDPHSAFYAREALGVKTWDLFDYVIGAWGADMDRILSIGGDEGLDRSAGTAKANRFKPVVKFMGPFYLKKGQSQTHRFKLPPYIGSVKAMVVAGQEGAYGMTEKTAAVKKPLMLLTSLPRVLGPSETIQLPVTVFGLENNIRNATVTLNTSSLLEVVGENSKTVTFSRPGEQMVYFDVRVKPQVGVAKVKVTASSGSERAEETTELQVRNPNPVITNTLESTVEGHSAWSTAFSPVGMSGTNTGTLEISTIPALNLAKRLNYLVQYPHGCIEQTTSGVFPQLMLNQLTDLTSGQQAEIDHNIKAGINRIKGFQASDGGFSYWPGEGQSDEWGTNYAGHFLLEAQAKGYALPPGLLDQWKKYQRNKANTWAPGTYNFYGGDLIQAYRLYLLALAKVPELGAMNRLKAFQYLSVAAKWRLAAAYRLSGQPEVANALVKNLPTTVKPYHQLGGTFGSDLRDKAMILETLTAMGQRASAGELVKQIAALLSQESWYSTQTTAYCLIAIARYCGSNANGSKMSFTYQLNGTKGSVNSNSYITQIPVTFTGAAGNVSLQNNGQNVLYARLILQGQPEAGQEPVAGHNPDVLDVQVKYSTRNGKPLDPASLHQGTDFMATVTIRNPGKRGYYEQMALSQIFPSGWEILNTRLLESDSAFSQSPFTYMDIRDDRVYTYFNLEENKTHTYNVLLNAAYLGRYYLPATTCEAMYDNNIHDFAPGKWIEVVR
ncbi:MAG TPA: MG2 domain-containing protein [Chitinophaga sp.]|uniref:alpha-2-macroglobulin family protein n=1 Tax=Chitinophaga sp. TaxID=1869181 RepID=UPI002DBE498C|nr:MG2 domain-containing protein [Chitinophaga sp.]HEU4555400.1 MG2 domain-containing protein [Chitinophaga sp.]